MNEAANLRLFSKDPHKQVGACLVLDGVIIGKGYNDFPKDTKFKWKKEGPWLETKHPYVIHAEVKAMASALGDSLRNHILVVDELPCYVCSKLIAACGITHVIWKRDRRSKVFRAARKLFKKTKIKSGRMSKQPAWLSDLSPRAKKTMNSLMDDIEGVAYVINEKGTVVGSSKRQYDSLRNEAVVSLQKSLKHLRKTFTSPCSPPSVNHCNHKAVAAIFNTNPSIYSSSQLYVTLQPCNECAELILNSGITDVRYLQKKDKIEYRGSRTLLEEGGVSFEHLKDFKLKAAIASRVSAA